MNEILYGHNAEERIVGLHLFHDDQKTQESIVRVYTRDENDQLSHYNDTLYPTIWLSDMSFIEGFPRNLYQYQELEGDNFFKYVVVFKSWFTMWKAVRKIKERAFDWGITDTIKEYPPNLYMFKTPEEQYLMQTGKTMFKGMEFDEVHRFYFDLETYSSRKDAFPNAERDGDYIYIITAGDNRGFKATYYVDNGERENKIDHSKVRNGIRFFSEEEMLRAFVKDFKSIDPDTIENHNIFAFDFPYLMTRLDRYNIRFNVGRDGSEPDVYDSSKRFAERVIDFPHLKIAGRHIIDTMFETMNYDTFARDLPGYGLKVVAEYFGFAPEGRTYIEGDKLSQTWDDDPHAVLDYADDDVVEVSRLSQHLGGSTFYLTQMLPMPYQRAALAGTSTKIESLLVRVYLRKRHSMPTREIGKQEVGGYTDLFKTGIYNNVIYADVASLYPSIMLNYGVFPEGDDLGMFSKLLRLLTDLRLETKAKLKDYEKGTEMHQKFNAMQSSYKVMINCFSDDTSIMTSSGAKEISNVEVGDLVWSINPKTMKAEYKRVSDIYSQEYFGDMYHFNSKHVDLKVTPEHRFLSNEGTWNTAKEIYDGGNFKFPAKVELNQGVIPSGIILSEQCQLRKLDFKLSEDKTKIKDPRRQSAWIPNQYTIEDWLELTGWIISEGGFYESTRREYDNGNVRGVTSRIMIYQKKSDIRPIIKNLLDRMNLRYSETKDGFAISNKILFDIFSKDIGIGSYNVRIPKWNFLLTPEILKNLEYSLMLGDGHATGYKYSTASSELATDVQRLFLKLGYQSNVTEEKNHYKGKSIYRVSRNSNRGISPVLKNNHKSKINYDGIIYCLTVEDNHTVMAGRNGIFNWTGQSFYGQLGFSMSLFNDFSEADRVTVIGQQLLRQMIRLITDDGGEVVEVDTDGILTMAPEFVYTLGDDEDYDRAFHYCMDQAERYFEESGDTPDYDIELYVEHDDEFLKPIDDESYVKQLTERMPDGIIIDFDGRAKRMMSYKKKNYALREPGKDKDKVKGGSMVSRQYEPFALRYIREIIAALMSRDIRKVAEIHRSYLSMIQNGNWTPDDFRKRSRIKEAVESYIAKVKRGVGNGGRNRDAGYELAIKRWEDTGMKPEAGDTIFYYIGGDKAATTLKVFQEATTVDTWVPGAENTKWYTYRLNKKIASKFEKFFTKEDFKLIFSDVPMESIDFDAIEIHNKNVRRDLVSVVFVGPSEIADDFWVERAVAGAKFLKTLDKQDHGYTIGHIITIDEEGMNQAVKEWAKVNGIPVTTVDHADEETFGKMAHRKTAMNLIETANAMEDMETSVIVIQDDKSNNNLAFEVARIADTDGYRSHISTTV